MVKNILGFLAGIIVYWLTSFVLHFILFFLSPKPVGFDPQSLSFMKEYYAGMPVWGLGILAFSHLAGAFIGALVMAKIVVDKSIVFPIVMGVLLMLGWTANIVTIPHPTWVVALVYVIYVPSAIFGFRTGAALDAE